VSKQKTLLFVHHLSTKRTGVAAQISLSILIPPWTPELNPQPSTLNHHDPFGLDGESTPINPYESTREWLERQGLKIPKGARIVTAG